MDKLPEGCGGGGGAGTQVRISDIITYASPRKPVPLKKKQQISRNIKQTERAKSAI